MTNLDSIFKSGDITLPTKVRQVKAPVFPVVMPMCLNWQQPQVHPVPEAGHPPRLSLPTLAWNSRRWRIPPRDLKPCRNKGSPGQA